MFLVATPIGNISDISIRALKTLFTVDFIACEDTRRTSLFLSLLKKEFADVFPLLKITPTTPSLISFFDEVENTKSIELIQYLRNGKNIALVSDAGSPLISDPGYKLVQICLKNNIPITTIPGPSASIAALSVSGLPVNNFYFFGFLPSKQGQRIKILSDLFRGFKNLEAKPTLIFYESSIKLGRSLSDLKEIFGDIKIVICRELTKMHEEVWSGKISDALSRLANFKGELVILTSFKP